MGKNEIGGTRRTYGREEGLYRVWVGKHKGKKPLGRPRNRLENNIRMDLQEVGFKGLGWTEIAQDRVRCAGICECGNEPSGSRGISSLGDKLLASQDGLCCTGKVISK